MSYSLLLCFCIFIWKTVVYALKEIPKGAKDTKDQTLLSCHALQISVLVRRLVQNKPNIWLCYRVSCPADCRFHLDSPLPISL